MMPSMPRDDLLELFDAVCDGRPMRHSPRRWKKCLPAIPRRGSFT